LRQSLIEKRRKKGNDDNKGRRGDIGESDNAGNIKWSGEGVYGIDADEQAAEHDYWAGSDEGV
jgi:hypothetical protein